MSGAQAPTEKLPPSIEVGAPADAQEPAEEWPPSFDVVAPSGAQISTDLAFMGLKQDAGRTADKPETLARKRGREIARDLCRGRDERTSRGKCCECCWRGKRGGCCKCKCCKN